MNIQIFGKSKCFDTKKAERYFKERRIKYQMVDVVRYGMSKGEFTSVCRAVGLEALIDPKAKDPEAAARIRQILNANAQNANARFVDMALSDKGLQVSRS